MAQPANQPHKDCQHGSVTTGSGASFLPHPGATAITRCAPGFFPCRALIRRVRRSRHVALWLVTRQRRPTTIAHQTGWNTTNRWRARGCRSDSASLTPGCVPYWALRRPVPATAVERDRVVQRQRISSFKCTMSVDAFATPNWINLVRVLGARPSSNLGQLGVATPPPMTEAAARAKRESGSGEKRPLLPQ